jgi:N-acyl-D-amino-acid deacylase
MVDEDIRTFYEQPWVMVASDGGIGMRHPRAAGTFPRVLGRYVREQKWLTLPEAVRKMTSTPAARLRLADRGRIAPGFVADLVLFDPATVIDRSTFQDPSRLPEGIKKVMVGGVLVWDTGRATGAYPGQVVNW